MALGSLFVFVTLLTTIVTSYNPKDYLWPLPEKVICDQTVLYSIEEENFDFRGSGPGGELGTLTLAFERYRKILFPPLLNDKINKNGAKLGASELKELEVIVSSAKETLLPETDESYDLEISKHSAQLTAATVYGALKGIETFSQLVHHDNTGSSYVASCVISDRPRFSYRSTLVDTSRHFIPIDVLQQHLDTMSYNKFNVFHWHIVDGQSFPYQSYTFPELSGKGAYDQFDIYSQSDVAGLIEYARNRGIRVIPEFDTPGHTDDSWGAIPNLLTPCYKPNTTELTGEYGPINPTLESTFTFLEAFYKEISSVFPDEFIHLGGDEVSFDCWASNPDIQKWMAAHNFTSKEYAKLEEYYEQRLIDIVGNLGKSYIVWQEIFDNGVKVKEDTVIAVWKSSSFYEEVANITAAGYKVILSACWYLNYISYGEDWVKYYQCDPQNFTGTATQKDLVMGGSAAVWGEYVDGTNLISTMWPRASIVGERLWSPQTVRNVKDAGTRLHNHRCRLIRRGIPAEPTDGPSYCIPEYDPMLMQG